MLATIALLYIVWALGRGAHPGHGRGHRHRHHGGHRRPHRAHRAAHASLPLAFRAAVVYQSYRPQTGRGGH